jgi:cell division initiation protein
MLRKIADLKTRLTAAEAKNAELAQELEGARAEAEAARAAAASRPAAAAQPVASGKPDIYTATEEQLSAALIVAQQTADRIVSEAKANAERIRVDAEAQARKVIRQALDEKQTELDEIERLKVSRENFRSEYLALIQKFTDAASANFPLMGSSRPSGSEASVISAPRSATSVIPVESNPYGAQVESAPIDDLD